MNEMTITFGRALKIWWSVMWRGFVLMIPVSIALMIVGFAMFPTGTLLRADSFSPLEMMGILGRMSLLWTIASVVVQVLAIKWALKTRWSDFHLVPQPNDAVRSPPAA
jgi:hypothetical protein